MTACTRASQVSPDGRLLAFTLDTVGGERYSLHLRELSSSGGGGDASPGDESTATAAGLAPQVAWAADGASLLGCQLVGAASERSGALESSAAPAPGAFAQPATSACRMATTEPAGWSGGLCSRQPQGSPDPLCRAQHCCWRSGAAHSA